MVYAANGLGDATLKPWLLRAHYQAYDAYGRRRSTGTAEYLWAGPNHWRETFTEAGSTWSQWQTKDGVYTPQEQTTSEPAYPASLLMDQFLEPLGPKMKPENIPSVFTKESIGGSKLACFNYRQPDRNSPFQEKVWEDRACTTQEKPYLLMNLGNYNVFFQQLIAFQHRIVPKHISMKDGADSVLDVDLDFLKTPSSEELASLQPPIDAAFCPAAPSSTPGVVTAGRLIRRVNPEYPQSAKVRAVQGTVRIAAKIGKDGRLSNVTVLHSPDLDLTHDSCG